MDVLIETAKLVDELPCLFVVRLPARSTSAVVAAEAVARDGVPAPVDQARAQPRSPGTKARG